MRARWVPGAGALTNSARGGWLTIRALVATVGASRRRRYTHLRNAAPRRSGPNSAATSRFFAASARVRAPCLSSPAGKSTLTEPSVEIGANHATLSDLRKATNYTRTSSQPACAPLQIALLDGRRYIGSPRRLRGERQPSMLKLGHVPLRIIPLKLEIRRITLRWTVFFCELCCDLLRQHRRCLVVNVNQHNEPLRVHSNGFFRGHSQQRCAGFARRSRGGRGSTRQPIL